MRRRHARDRARRLASLFAALALLTSLPLAALGAETTAPTIAVPTLSPTSAAQGAAVTVTTTATDASGVTAVEVRIDAGTWNQMNPGRGGTVSTTRGGAILVNAAVDQVRAGFHHSCAVARGLVLCWGEGWGAVPVAVSGITTASSVTTSLGFSCARLTSGAVKCWGDNGHGQLGNGTFTGSASPVDVLGISTAVSVVAGTYHACALLADHTLRCWGRNGEGQIGAFDEFVATPVAIPGITTATSVAPGENHTCALLSTGSIRCWGENSSGQLGDGNTNAVVGPVSVSGITTATSISAGAKHTCAVLSTGAIRCWGAGGIGRLGDGQAVNRPTPVAAVGITTATTVSAGHEHTCARLANSSVWCWGSDEYGQLGTAGFHSVPTSVPWITGASSVSAGWFHTCARLADSTVRCFGYNSSGQLGFDPAADFSSTLRSVPGITTATGVTAGGHGTCALIAPGAVSCWGNDATPTPVAGITTATALSAGGDMRCALLANSSVRCWGQSDYGLGDGTTNTSATPVTVAGITTATAISLGPNSACIRLADATARCWGLNDNGQLGDGTTTNRAAPVAVLGLTNVEAVRAADHHSCALIAGGAVNCWGSNQFGQLGDGGHADHLAPVAVSGITSAGQITAGDAHGCALLTDGTVRCWGDNSYWQLGKDSFSMFESATPVSIPGVSGATAISGSANHTCVRIPPGTLMCWGFNEQGGLGYGTASTGGVPGIVLGVTTASEVSAGGTANPSGHSCARLDDSTIRCWGANEEGQLGTLPAGQAAHPGLEGLIGSLSAGVHQVCVRARDIYGNTSAGTACATLTVLDKTGPTATAPTVKLRSAVSLTGTSLRVTYAWAGTDNTGGSGVNHYELAKSTDGGTTWAAYAGTLTSTSATASIPPSGTVRIRVRATDNAGNIGAWATGPVLTQKSIEESSAAITYAGTWATGASASYSGGGSRSASVAGASAQHTFRGRSIALVTTTGPTRGAVKVYVDGALVKTVDSYSATTAYRVQAWAQSWTTVGTHTVKFVVVGTAGRPRVDVDSLVIVGWETVPVTQPPVTGGGNPGTGGGDSMPGTDAVGPSAGPRAPNSTIPFVLLLAGLMLALRLSLGRRAGDQPGRRDH